MLELSRKNAPIDLISLAEELRAGSRLDEVGGPAYLAELAASTVSAANALHHAAIVREKSVQRKLISTAVDIITRCYEGGQETDQLLDESEQAIFSIADSRTTKGIHSAKDLITKVFEQIEKRIENKELVTGVPTGYYQFDEYTAGLQPSDLIIVAGRPSMIGNPVSFPRVAHFVGEYEKIGGPGSFQVIQVTEQAIIEGMSPPRRVWPSGSPRAARKGADAAAARTSSPVQQAPSPRVTAASSKKVRAMPQSTAPKGASVAVWTRTRAGAPRRKAS